MAQDLQIAVVMTASTLPLTSYARRAHNLALTFEASVKRIFKNFSVEVTPTDASTHNGKQAMQLIRLVAKDGRALVIGWANTSDGTAELRTLGHALATSKERYGKELTIPPVEYMRYLEEAHRVLTTFELKVTIVAYTKPSVPPVSGSNDASKAEVLPYYGLVAGAAVTLAAVTFLISHS